MPQEIQRTVELFMRECSQCSTLRHPNVIQFLSVYYPSTAGVGGVQGRMQLPVMVMEMMADSLTSLKDKHKKIPVHIKSMMCPLACATFTIMTLPSSLETSLITTSY